jgi:hypothetical protein
MKWLLSLIHKIMGKLSPQKPVKTDDTVQRPKFGVLIIGDLPYYVPVPEEFALEPSEIGVEPFQIMFTHFKPLRHPDDSQGENIDDRVGTYIRSRCHVSFYLMQQPQGNYKEEFEQKALSIANKALRAIRYKAYDPAIRHVSKFENCVIHTLEFNQDGTTKPLSEVSLKTNYGPFGIRPLGTLKNDSLQDVWWYFNGLMPIPSAWFLILDSKYHNATGDITHACLDLATALEINIDGLIEYYLRYDPTLSQIDLDGKNIYQKYDEIMLQVTGHSLHEQPNHFVNLEYIYAIRNSIAHTWKAEFRINERMRHRTRYLDKHIKREGEVIQNSAQVNELIKAAEEILSYTVNMFHAKFDTNG